MENTFDTEKFDRRKITSPQNGKRGGRPRIWKINPYQMITQLRKHPTPYTEQDIKELQSMIAHRRKQNQKKELAKYHKRPDLALKQIQNQKDRRQKKLAELRYLRMVVRRLLLQLDEVETSDLDIKRTPSPERLRKEAEERDFYENPDDYEIVFEVNPVYLEKFRKFREENRRKEQEQKDKENPQSLNTSETPQNEDTKARPKKIVKTCHQTKPKI